MPIFPNKILLNTENTGSFPIVDTEHVRGTVKVIERLNSASLAPIGAGSYDIDNDVLVEGLRDLGTIVYSDSDKKYYVFQPQINDTDTNISGSTWTTTTNWNKMSLGQDVFTTSEVEFSVVSASKFSGSGQDLTNIPASGITGLNLSQIGTGSFTASMAVTGGLSVNTHITASGDISASGKIIANSLEVGGSSVGASLIVTDINASGNITASRNISGSSKSTGSFGRVEAQTFKVDGALEADTLDLSSITASGFLSASEGIITPGILFTDTADSSDSAFSAFFPQSDNTLLIGNSPNRIVIRAGLNTNDDDGYPVFINTPLPAFSNQVDYTAEEVVSASLVVKGSIYSSGSQGHITASGNIVGSGNLNITNITASGAITASGFRGNFLEVTNSIIITSASTEFGDSIDDTHIFSGSLDITGSITASGEISTSANILTSTNISASGTVFGTNIYQATESIAHITASIFTLSSSLGQTTESIISLSSSLGHATESIISLSSSLGQTTESIISLSSSLGQTTESVISLSSSLGQTTESVISLSSSLGQTTESIISLSSSLGQATESIIALSSSLGQATESIIALSSSLQPSSNVIFNNITANGDIFNQSSSLLLEDGVVVNTFTTSSFRTAKYLIQVSTASEFQSSEILLMHSGSKTFQTEYAQLSSDGVFTTFESDISESQVRLIASSSFISCSISFKRTLISV